MKVLNNSILRIITLFIIGITPLYFNYALANDGKVLIFGIFLLLYLAMCTYRIEEAISLFLIFSYLIKFNYPIYSYVRVNHVLFLIIIVVAVLGKFKFRDFRVKVKACFSRFFILNIVFIFVMLLTSRLHSINIWDSYRVIIVYGFSIIVFIFLIIGLINKTNEERKKIIYSVLKITSLSLSIMGLFTLIGSKYLNMWDQYFNIIPSGSFLRLHFSEDPNYFGAFLLPGLIVYIYNIKSLKKHQLIEMSIVLLAFILTLSFGNFIAFFFGLLLIVLDKFKSLLKIKSLKSKINKKSKIIIIAMVAVLLVCSPVIIHKFSGVIKQKQISSSERLDVWKDGFAMNLKGVNTFLIGIGADNAKYNTSYYKKTSYPRDMHNSLLQLYAENGVIGTFVFIAMCVMLIKASKNYALEKIMLLTVLADFIFIGMFNVFCVWYIMFAIYTITMKEVVLDEK
ncbi:MAG: O-antigen ligase family protein [Bacillota bacterium]|nr:O-antigen ligase family protein [Bacillota bacterium]